KSKSSSNFLSPTTPPHSSHRHEHLRARAGLFFSFMTFNWLTPLAVHAHRKGQLQLEDVWVVSQFESCKVNRHRLAGLWEERRVKGDEASLCGVVWAFCRTRLLLSILCLMVTQLAGFSGPVRHNRSPDTRLNPNITLLILCAFYIYCTFRRICLQRNLKKLWIHSVT
uniref:Uncharacterized protein n=1 Tax=Oncorhynchus mykiss TaxID=8022 RepID=A0A8C7V398_ONCMY